MELLPATVPPHRAQAHMDKANGNIERAVELFFAEQHQQDDAQHNGGGEARAAVKPTPPSTPVATLVWYHGFCQRTRP